MVIGIAESGMERKNQGKLPAAVISCRQVNFIGPCDTVPVETEGALRAAAYRNSDETKKCQKEMLRHNGRAVEPDLCVETFVSGRP
jgi:hypothetical protein